MAVTAGGLLANLPKLARNYSSQEPLEQTQVDGKQHGVGGKRWYSQL